MKEQFKGVVNVDVRDSVPDWAPFLQPQAPEGAPNVLMIVWDDVGYGAMDVFGGPIETPTHAAPRRPWACASELPHHRAVLADALEPADRPQRDAATAWPASPRAPTGFPGYSARIPFENGTIAEVLNERGWNTYCVGKWHLTPAEECDMSVVEGPLAAGPRLRALLRLPRRRDQPVVSGPHLRQPPVEPPLHAGGRLPPLQGPGGQGASSSSATRSRSRPTSRGSCTSRRARRTRRTTSPRSGRTLQGPLRPGLRGDPRRRSWRDQQQLGLLAEDVQLSPINPHGEPDVHGARRPAVAGSSTSSARGTR